MTEQTTAHGTEQGPVPVTVMAAVDRMVGSEYGGHMFKIDESLPITADDLHTLAGLPYEVGLYKDDQRGTVLVQGDAGSVSMRGATRNARLLLHSHPSHSGAHMMSGDDVLVTWAYNHDNTTHMIATPEGLVSYRAPQRDPSRSDAPIEDPRVTLLRWGRDRGINLFTAQ